MELILVFLVSFVMGWLIVKGIKHPHKALEAKKNKEIEYSAMIHRTQELEKSELGEVKTECECAKCKPRMPDFSDVQDKMEKWRKEDERIKAEVERLKKKYQGTGWTASALELSSAERHIPKNTKTKYCIKCNAAFVTTGSEYYCLACTPKGRCVECNSLFKHNSFTVGDRKCYDCIYRKAMSSNVVTANRSYDLANMIPAQYRACHDCAVYEEWGQYEHPISYFLTMCYAHRRKEILAAGTMSPGPSA
jgi:hypothetical protein